MSAAALLARLVELDYTVATAESLTGGLIGARITAEAGSSAAFVGGIVAYTHAVKASALGVDPALLARRGAVNDEVARAMAVGARRALSADVGISATGVAGPEPSDGQPVGTVFVAVATPDTVDSLALTLSGSRNDIREASVVAALRHAVSALSGTRPS